MWYILKVLNCFNIYDLFIYSFSGKRQFTFYHFVDVYSKAKIKAIKQLIQDFVFHNKFHFGNPPFPTHSGLYFVQSV